FSDWQGVNDILENELLYGDYYFSNSYESASPASKAIISDVSTKAFVLDTSIREVVDNNEIPSGCVLCLSNNIVGTGVANTSSYYTVNTNKHMVHSTYLGNLRTIMDGYYTDGSFGLITIKKDIQSVELTTYGMEGIGYRVWEWKSDDITSYIFPLASSASASSFKWNTYLTSDQMALSATQWLRDGVESSTSYNSSEYTYYQGSGSFHSYKYPSKQSINSNGVEVGTRVHSTSPGYRPAFVLKI
ncbi:MAG: hypothetical protein ACLRFR_00035, partial [Clostridia bacterium]